MNAPLRAEPLHVVWAYRRTGKFAFHVLTGALESDPRTQKVPIEFANGVEAVLAAIDAARACGARVLVGWSFYSPDFVRLAAELRAVQAARPGAALHVAGGVHAAAEPLATLRAGFDLVAIGEGERLVRDLVHALATGGDPRTVDGLAWLENGALRRTGRAARVPLDEFPPFGPAHARFGPIEITRGCVYACRFCQTPYFAGASFRHRSVANVREWVRFLVGRGFRDLRFLTPTSLSYGANGPEPELAAVEALLAGVREDIGPERRLWFGTFPSEVRQRPCARRERARPRRGDDRTCGGAVRRTRLRAARRLPVRHARRTGAGRRRDAVADGPAGRARRQGARAHVHAAARHAVPQGARRCVDERAAAAAAGAGVEGAAVRPVAAAGGDGTRARERTNLGRRAWCFRRARPISAAWTSRSFTAPLEASARARQVLPRRSRKSSGSAFGANTASSGSST